MNGVDGGWILQQSVIIHVSFFVFSDHLVSIRRYTACERRLSVNKRAELRVCERVKAPSVSFLMLEPGAVRISKASLFSTFVFHFIFLLAGGQCNNLRDVEEFHPLWDGTALWPKASLLLLFPRCCGSSLLLDAQSLAYQVQLSDGFLKMTLRKRRMRGVGWGGVWC